MSSFTVHKDRIPVGISSCLIGNKVRFDGGHKNNSFIANVLAQHFDFQPFCPEMAIGMGTPREPIRLVETDQGVRCVGTKSTELDVTDELLACTDHQQEWHSTLCGYILKKDSPSCGMERVKLYHNGMPKREGVGLYAGRMMKNFGQMPVEEEGRLGDAVLRENFIQRVFIYSRFKQMVAEGGEWRELSKFHARHKYIYMSHHQELARELGRWLAKHTSMPTKALLDAYLDLMMTLLKHRASRNSHTNTLMHIQGYLKQSIDKDDKQELTEVIDQYRQGLIPLVVPITLLKHHFLKNPHPYITDTYYMQPHPSELMLLNSL